MTAAAKPLAVLFALIVGTTALTGCGPSIEAQRADWEECFKTAGAAWLESDATKLYDDEESLKAALIRVATEVCGEMP